MSSNTNTILTRVASGIATLALAFASVTTTFPSPALADIGKIHINEVSASGEKLPESTIMIYDSLNTVVGKSVNNTGLSEFDLPPDATSKLKAGSTYTITATAEGYSFNSVKGTLLDDRTVIVNLTGTKTVSMRVQLSAEGVSDFSYVTAALYDGGNVAAAAKSTATASANGVVEFKDVPVGAEYTIRLTCPSNLAGQLPELTTVEVNPDQTGVLDVEIKGTAAALDIEEPTVTEVPEPLQKYEAPVEQQQVLSEEPPRPVSTQPIAQTGDAVVLVAGGVIGVAVIVMVVLIVRRK